MAISASDVIPLSHARANFSELAEDVRAGAEKIITKNGEPRSTLLPRAVHAHPHGWCA
jgi:prevent-host-death family protein